MRLAVNGEIVEVVGPSGPAGPDGNPVGTVISFLGVGAPEGYLVCDGAEYSVSDYPALADFFEAQFGTKNHFGGDGAATFAVPDMRNLFLRGFHGEAEEQLSGGIGERQEATVLPHINAAPKGNASYCCVFTQGDVQAPDSMLSPSMNSLASAQSWNNDFVSYGSYTVRPVNTAVLYCVKAVEGSGGGGLESSEEIYSTEETRIGTWIDGKPIYRICFQGNTGAANKNVSIFDMSEYAVDTIINLYGSIFRADSSPGQISLNAQGNNWHSLTQYLAATKAIVNIVTDSIFENCRVAGTVEYTKTTDPAAEEA